jgi:hypothetical protein
MGLRAQLGFFAREREPFLQVDDDRSSRLIQVQRSLRQDCERSHSWGCASLARFGGLGSARGGTVRPEEAVAAYRAALEVSGHTK